MLTFPLSPGVYVDEPDVVSFSASRAATAVPVFVTGPAAEQPWWAAAGQPVIVRSFGEYEQALRSPARRRSRRGITASRFLPGSPAPRSGRGPSHWPTLAGVSVGEAGAEVDWSRPLAPALKVFFDNGGGWCYLCPRDQLAAVESLPDVTLVVQAGEAGTESDILALCQPGSGLFALLDGPQHEGTFSAGALEAHLATLSPSESAALYYPWLQADWLLRDESGQRVKDMHPVAPSAVAAGLLCQTDRQAGPWKAPANLAVSAGLTPAVRVGDNAQARFTSADFAAMSVNMFRAFSGRGVQLWGARTLTAGGSAWGYIQVRRTFDMVERDLQRALAAALFEPNGPETWRLLRATAENYLYTLMQQGAFAGITEAESYRVEAGLGSTMSEADVQAGTLRLRIWLAVVRPAEFVVLEFSQQPDAAGGGAGGLPVVPEPEPVKEFVLAEAQLPAFEVIDGAIINRMGNSISITNDGILLAIHGCGINALETVFKAEEGNWRPIYISNHAYDGSIRPIFLSGDGAYLYTGFEKYASTGLVHILAKKNDSYTNNGWIHVMSSGGSSFAVSNPMEWLAVGAPGAIINDVNAGAIQFSKDNAEEPTMEVHLETPADNDLFGTALAMNDAGTLLIASAPGRNADAGVVTTWTRDGDVWTLAEAMLSPQQPGKFGASVALSRDGNVLAVGSPEENDEQGAVYVYQREQDSWLFKRRLTEANTLPGDRFGRCVALSGDGDMLVIASQITSDSGNGGAVRVYEKEQDWFGGTGRLLPHEQVEGDEFGYSLALNHDGSRLAVGAPGAPGAAEGETGKVWLYEIRST